MLMWEPSRRQRHNFRQPTQEVIDTLTFFHYSDLYMRHKKFEQFFCDGHQFSRVKTRARHPIKVPRDVLVQVLAPGSIHMH